MKKAIKGLEICKDTGEVRYGASVTRSIQFLQRYFKKEL